MGSVMQFNPAHLANTLPLMGRKDITMFASLFAEDFNSHVYVAQDAWNLRLANAAKELGIVPRSIAWDNFVAAYIKANPTTLFG